jgi:hypothetical protein
MAEYLILVWQHVHHHVPVVEVGERCGCIVVDVQVQVVGPRQLVFIFELVLPLVSSISILGGRLHGSRRRCNGSRRWWYERNAASAWRVDTRLWW